MKKSSKKQPKAVSGKKIDAYIEGAGIVEQQNIVDTLRENYMPYAMSVIISRALPEIDGFKPSHRKLLYTMYKMGLLNGARTKSANIVGQTMKLNPHGDQAIYETMVRLARGNEALLHPFVDSKGNFGKAYSRNMAYAASRYTEAKLEPICAEIFGDIDKDTVDFVPNYDNTLTEPTLFPVRFPSILINSNIGIAVSMASNICPFNLREICETTIALMKDPEHDVSTTLNGPDFPGGGYIVYDENEMQKVYKTGTGGIKVRAKYTYDKDANCIDVTEIPPTTTVEAIIDKVVELVKLGKIKEISDLRDETDLSGLKLTFDLKRGVNPDALMQKLYKLTPLQDTFSANFNIIIGGNPRVMGVYEILTEWIAFRIECVKRMVYFELNKKKDKLHLLLGLQKILLDIDKAIRIIRETKEEAEVVPNLMIGFGIDEIQAEYVAEIKLRHINQEYILKRTDEIGNLRDEIADMEETLESPRKIKKIIIKELEEISDKYGQNRKTKFAEIIPEEEEAEEEIPDYPLNIFLTKEGYFKRVTPQSLRMSGEHKFKEGDSLVFSEELSNRTDLLFFTNKHQVYKSRVSDFSDTKISTLGDYIPAKLEFEPDEKIVAMIPTNDYHENLVLFFKNGKCAKVPLVSYETKTKRKKLANAYSDNSELIAMFKVDGDADFILRSDAGKVLIFSTMLVLPKSSRNTQGVQVMRLTKAQLENAALYEEGTIKKPETYITKTIPAAGTLMKNDFRQLKFE